MLLSQLFCTIVFRGLQVHLFLIPISCFSLLTIVESKTPDTGGGAGDDIVSTAALAGSPALLGRDGGNSRAGGRVATVDGESGDISQVDGFEPLLDLSGVGWGDGVERRELGGVEGGRCGGGSHQGDGDGRKNGLHGCGFCLCKGKLLCLVCRTIEGREGYVVGCERGV